MSGHAYITVTCDPDVKQSVKIITRAAVRRTKSCEHVWQENEQEFTLYVTGTDEQLDEARKIVRRLSRGKPRFVIRMETWSFEVR